MSQSLYRKLLLLLGALIIFHGCGIVAFNNIAVLTFPDTPNSVLEEGEIVTITFSMPVISKGVERLISISCESRKIETDYFWEGKVVKIVPLKEYLPGRKYILEARGDLPLSDGNSTPINLSIPFYYLSDSPLMTITSVEPEDPFSFEPDTPLALTFSYYPEETLFRRYFSISPEEEIIISRSEKEISVIPVEDWKPLEQYSWNLEEEFSSELGIPLLRSYTGFFMVQKNPPPRITSLFPTLFDGEYPVPLSENLKDLPYKGSIGISFSESVKADSLRDAFNITPEIGGFLLKYSDDTFVFSPADGWDYQTLYCLSISTKLQDQAGNSLAEPFEVFFQPSLIPPVEISSIEGAGGIPVSFILGTLDPQKIDVNVLDLCSYSFSISFTQSYDSDFHKNIEDALRFQYIFPGGNQPDIRRILWGPDLSSLTITYENIAVSSPFPGASNIFRFSLSGGVETRNQNGGYIAEETILILECTE